jgi:hypothetical protein
VRPKFCRRAPQLRKCASLVFVRSRTLGLIGAPNVQVFLVARRLHGDVSLSRYKNVRDGLPMFPLAALRNVGPIQLCVVGVVTVLVTSHLLCASFIGIVPVREKSHGNKSYPAIKSLCEP